MKYVFAALLPALLFATPLVAQVPSGSPTVEQPRPAAELRPVEADRVYTSVEHMPELPGGGGKVAIVAAIQRAARYPASAMRSNVEGRVFVSFVVEPSGLVSTVRVVKGLGSGLDEETIRAVNTLPRFHPGTQNGQAVRVAYLIPITYSMR
jgi:protein TonB